VSAPSCSALLKVAQAYEAWEARIFFEADWDDGLPKFTQPLFEQMLEIQAMRNEALERRTRAHGSKAEAERAA
jgi:hypothetical protein